MASEKQKLMEAEKETLLLRSVIACLQNRLSAFERAHVGESGAEDQVEWVDKRALQRLLTDAGKRMKSQRKMISPTLLCSWVC
tara:strand:- start:414 stop:662 length:249 start_codon:yes stop_codon:yes gene_type:complete